MSRDTTSPTVRLLLFHDIYIFFTWNHLTKMRARLLRNETFWGQPLINVHGGDKTKDKHQQINTKSHTHQGSGFATGRSRSVQYGQGSTHRSLHAFDFPTIPPGLDRSVLPFLMYIYVTWARSVLCRDAARANYHQARVLMPARRAKIWIHTFSTNGISCWRGLDQVLDDPILKH